VIADAIPRIGGFLSARSRLCFWSLLLIGCALRVALYLQRHPIWLDEAMLAMNVIEQPIGSLLGRPLQDGQVCPAGFLLCAKVAEKLFGPGPLALRSVSLVASFVFLGASMCWLRRHFDELTALVCLSLVALTGYLVLYGTEFKQYGLEAAVNALLLCVIYPGAAIPRMSLPRSVLIGIAGAVSVLFSLSSIFVIAGYGSVVLVQLLREKRTKDFWLFSSAVALAATTFILYYLTILRFNSMDHEMLRFQASSFAPFPPR
jgi:uncharacterized membrane protein